MKVYCSGKLLAGDVALADSFFTRFKGLMGKKNMGAEQGLLLKNCPSVHCFFMKMPIDVVYISKEMKILDVETLRPWSIGKLVKGAAHVLELCAGVTADRVKAGDTIAFNA